MVLITNFDNKGYNSTADPYLLGINLREHDGWSADVETHERPRQAALRTTFHLGSRDIPFTVLRNPAYTGVQKTPAQFRAEVFGYFSPYNGERILTALHDDGVTEIYLQVDVVSINFLGQTKDNAEAVGVFRAVDPLWRKTTARTDTGNAGNVDSYPTITLSGGTTCSRLRYRITETTGNGIVAHPIKLPTTLGSDSWVFDRGRSIPFKNNWIRLDLFRNQTIEIDVYSSTGITNQLAEKLDLGGLDLVNSTNTSWVINSWKVSQHPNGSGSPKPGKIGTTYRSISYGLTAEGDAQAVYKIAGTDQYDRQYDCSVCTTGVPIGNITLTADSGGATCRDARIFLKKLMPHSTRWETVIQAETTPQDFLTSEENLTLQSLSITGTHNLNGAIAWLVGIEPTRSIEQHKYDSASQQWDALGYQRAIGTLTMSSTVTMAITGAPTIESLGVAQAHAFNNLHVANSNSGDKIIIKRAFTIGNIIVNCHDKVITQSTGRAYLDVRFTNPDHWFRLQPDSRGGNSIALTAGLTATWSHRERWIL